MFGEIEDTGFEMLDPRFAACFVGHARVERLWSGGRWLEGPAWFGPGRYLIWSDIPNNRMMRWDETDGSVSVFRQPCNNSNGNTVDNHGRLVTCEHLTRRVTRTEFDGAITIVADRFEGRRFNSPNDIVVASDGAVWFTDPPYGIMHDYEGNYGAEEIGGCHVYRVAAATGAVTQVADDFVKPNGLAFSPDEKLLYVADSGATHLDGGPRHIRKFRVGDEGRLSGGDVFAECASGFFDGFRIDTKGRVWTSAGDGVHCFDPDGTLIGKIRIPETVANVTFGGVRRNRLFICATTSLYAVYLTANGSKLG
ncbi:SMP-30/gluconolactonase/LRE family protein [Mesorhizobium sp.]|uniref:SMP-30/gluconolactonase/LRE family protein n=1 Tax=Mesorhizobium sp. TaxID=1871066 RepID=UPI000FE70DE4|nr:SMP-30/gluconolactonase/LRE family protein [Mesorhizobium sp.]RWK42451.1 MAG: SMP-30/gluconolactonase/LRE family protein [Mesorhizobium sp.]RWK69495.1 MAG: SMP-30/gluconolactonase/LRE family protein [Mesorhizobium sp.]RWK79711.1 MAG: SMP-30/gluconolactonase/LRE family protein [Mesorhizobium sp.]RWK82487.1 MAG: SMP-30/gluconolactonase/LRE family protein [Mesorhizobium sp.]RWL08693.1 MAG: SMP-30/gluconolactonase/LRE family protein [Mesorhizobium sp.]